MVKRVVLYLFLIGLAVTMLCPFYWMVLISLRETGSLVTFRWWPTDLSLANYAEALTQLPVLLWLRNSVIVAVGQTLLTLTFDSMAGYAFARKSFPGRRALFLLVLAALMIPYQVTMIPVYLMMSKLRLVNTFVALILPSTTTFGVFFMRQYITTIPAELDEAARIDGCSEWGIYSRIVLPLARPALAALGIFTFMGSWNNFLYPLIMTNTDDVRPLTVGLSQLQGQLFSDWGRIMALSTLAFLPVLIVFLCLQRYFERGIVLSGLKG
jgi:multiple sugar transport system permease protein